MKRNNSNIKTIDVINYWLKSDIFINKPTINFKLSLGEETCFCCGDHRGNLEKAHIIPVSSGGSDDISNIHILCKSCHLRTESLTDIPIIGFELYFNFIKQHPELCLLREEISVKLIKKNIDIIPNKFKKNNFETKPIIEKKPLIINLEFYKKQIVKFKKERSKIIDCICKGTITDLDAKSSIKIVREEIEKYQSLIEKEKLNSRQQKKKVGKVN